jgi:nicotinate-nucleotide adenylyltransferase
MKIGLFGGSHNPIHEGHMDMGVHFHDACGADEIWYLFSKNRLTPEKPYAPLEHRMAMFEILKKAGGYPEYLIASDIEEQLGTHITRDVLFALRELYPEHQFIWGMGTDSLENFHLWIGAEDIIKNFPVVVAARTGSVEKALTYKAARRFSNQRVEDPEKLLKARHGWTMLDNPTTDASSSNLLIQMRAGRRIFPGPFQVVANYIFKNGLYGLGGPGPAENNTLVPAP